MGIENNTLKAVRLNKLLLEMQHLRCVLSVSYTTHTHCTHVNSMALSPVCSLLQLRECLTLLLLIAPVEMMGGRGKDMRTYQELKEAAIFSLRLGRSLSFLGPFLHSFLSPPSIPLSVPPCIPLSPDLLLHGLLLMIEEALHLSMHQLHHWVFPTKCHGGDCRRGEREERRERPKGEGREKGERGAEGEGSKRERGSRGRRKGREGE